MPMTIEQLADDIFALVREYEGRKKFTAREVTKTMMEKHPDEVDKKLCKQAIRILTDSNRCVFTYKGTSYLEIPKEE